jgi:hypothetical protein
LQKVCVLVCMVQVREQAYVSALTAAGIPLPDLLPGSKSSSRPSSQAGYLQELGGQVSAASGSCVEQPMQPAANGNCPHHMHAQGNGSSRQVDGQPPAVTAGSKAGSTSSTAAVAACPEQQQQHPGRGLRRSVSLDAGLDTATQRQESLDAALAPLLQLEGEPGEEQQQEGPDWRADDAALEALLRDPSELEALRLNSSPSPPPAAAAAVAAAAAASGV